MNRIREVFRNEYIGAVAIGFLLAQVIGGIVSLMMRPVDFYLERAAAPRSVFGRADTQSFPWPSLIGPAIDLLLLLLASFLLLRWLYLNPRRQPASAEAPQAPKEDHDKGDLE